MPPNRISPDEAFTEAYRSHRLLVYGDDPSTLPAPLSARPSGGKKRKRQEEEAVEEAGAGGFFTNEVDDSGGGGGFFVDDQNESHDGHDPQSNADEASSMDNQPTHLPISEIPHALTLLNLPNDDPSILSVFQNGAVDDPLGQVAASDGAAASGGSRRRNAAAGVIKVISRDDFKQVIEILLEDEETQRDDPESGEASAEEEEPQADRRRRRARPTARNLREDRDDDDDDEDDVYRESSDDEDDDDEEDEDFAQDSGRRRRGKASARKPSATSKSKSEPSRRRRRKVSSSPSESDTESEVRLTSSQRSQITDLWSMFTDKLDEVDPSWRSSSTTAQPRLTERELQRLAIVIGEKVSEKDVAEMLSLANSSFAPMSSKNATRQGARAAREAAARKRGAEEGGVGIDEFAGILVRGRMV